MKATLEELENIDLFLPVVHNNPRRTGVKTDIGCIFPLRAAQEYTAMKAVQARKRKESYAFDNMVATVIGALAVICLTVAALR